MSMARSSWSSRSVASAFAHKIFYVAIRFGGRWIAYFMLVFVVGFYTCLPAIRRRSQAYRRRRFDHRGVVRETIDIYRLQWEFGTMLVDRAVMGILGQFTMDASTEDRQTLADLAAEGRGLILVTAHVGCWQLGLSVLDHIDAPKAVVMYRNEQDVDRHYFEHGAEDNGPGFTVIDPRGPMGGTLEMMNILERGGVLCVMGDRDIGSQKNVVDVEFLGDSIEVPVSPYRLASAKNAPMVATFSNRLGAGHGRIWISKVIDVPEGLGRHNDRYRSYAQQFADGLAEYVRLHPYQFFNFYDMWNQ
jgi:predicted LPLAT superfamily acyltransferase